MGACISKKKQVHQERSSMKNFHNVVGNGRSPIIPSAHLSSLLLERSSISDAIASDVGALYSKCSLSPSKTLFSKGVCESKVGKELIFKPNSLQKKMEQNESDLFFINEDGGVELYEHNLDQQGLFFSEEKADDEDSSYIQAPTNSPDRIWQKQFFLQGSTSHHGRDGETSAKSSNDATKTMPVAAMIHELSTEGAKNHVLAAASIVRKSESSTCQELAMVNTHLRELNDYREKRRTSLQSSTADGFGNDSSVHNIKQSSDHSPGSNWVTYVQKSAVPEVDHKQRFSFGAGPYKAARAMSPQLDLPRNSCCRISHPLFEAPSKPMSFWDQEKKNPVRKKLGFFLLSNPLRTTAAISTKISTCVESQFHHLSTGGWEREDAADNSDSSSDLFEIDSVTAYLSSARSSRKNYVDRDRIDNSCSLADNTY